MLKNLKNELNISIFSSIIYIILGIIIIANPVTTLAVVGYMLAIFSIVIGIAMIIINIGRIKEENNLLLGVLLLLMGTILLIYPGSFGVYISLVVGVWYIASSVTKIKLYANLKDVPGVNFILILIGSILTLILGVMFICTPLLSAVTLTMVSGIMMIIYAIIDIIEVITIKKHLKEIEKAIN